MGLFDGDPKFEKLKKIRDEEGYKGWLDQDLNKVEDIDKWIRENSK